MVTYYGHPCGLCKGREEVALLGGTLGYTPAIAVILSVVCLRNALVVVQKGLRLEFVLSSQLLVV